MKITPAFFVRLKSFLKPAFGYYPLLIMLAIPSLLIINTVWNLRSFNRDINYLVRHQVSGIADTLKPVLLEKSADLSQVRSLLEQVKNANSELISLSLLEKRGNNFNVIATSSPIDMREITTLDLNKLAISYDQSFAGLSHSTMLNKDVWNVVAPLQTDKEPVLLLNLQSGTGTIETVLTRTSQDSFIVLAALIFLTLLLLYNHYHFYLRSLKTQQLEELDRMKNEFVSMAAHELKAPITALVGYLYMIKKKLNPEALTLVAKDLDILDKVTDELHDLINDLLDVSRIDQGRIKITLQPVAINEVIQNVIAVMTPNASEKNLQIIFIPQELPKIQSDPDRLRQILTNLVSNAIKYTLKGQITIEAEVKNNLLTITVKDTGIGIPASEMPKLFEKFYRVKDKQTEEVRGTGLGLWITRQIAQSLGGEIYVESIYGTGTNVTFSLLIVK